MLGLPTFMSGASIWGCERRMPCISLLPGASMRPSSRSTSAWKRPPVNWVSPSKGRKQAEPRTQTLSLLARQDRTYDFHADVDIEGRDGSLRSIDDPDVPGGTGCARHQGAYARRVCRGGRATLRSGFRAGHRGRGGGVACTHRRIRPAPPGDAADRRGMSPQGSRGTVAARSRGAAPAGEGDGVSLYGDAVRALRQVILLDERVRNTAVDPAAMSQAVADLHDSVSRLEGMVAAVMAPSD